MSLRTVVAFTAVAAAAAWAQTTRPARGEYVGYLSGTNVYVRSAPVDGYPCTKLSAPATVTVKGEQFGWLKIVPPPSCYSLIAKAYVTSTDGKTGTVAGNNVHVRAGSDLFPARTDEVQTRLKTGDKVAILGERGQWYKIIPPAGVTLWISSQYVQRRPGATRTLPVPPGPPTRPAPTTATAPAPPAPPEELNKALADFQAAEAELTKEFAKPREQRDPTALLARYRAIQIAKDSPLAPYLQARIDFLAQELELEKDRKAVADLVAKANAKQAELAAASARIRVPATQPVRTYAAEGLLSASDLFTGGPTGPKRYVITDPDSRLISAYVQCTTGVVDLSKFVGSYVGVVGTPTYDQQLRMYVVEADHVVVMRKGAAPPAKATPKANPATQPVPKPKATPKPKPKATPKPKPKPKTQPAAKVSPKPPAATAKPKPSGGLPVAKTTTRPAAKVNEAEYE